MPRSASGESVYTAHNLCDSLVVLVVLVALVVLLVLLVLVVLSFPSLVRE